MLPASVQDSYLQNILLPKYFDAVVIESTSHPCCLCNTSHLRNAYQVCLIMSRQLPSSRFVGWCCSSNILKRMHTLILLGVTGRYWSRNCGSALQGRAAWTNLQKVEVIVVPTGINISAFADLNNNSNVLTTAEEVTHAGLMLKKEWARRYVTPALVRVIKAVAP